MAAVRRGNRQAGFTLLEVMIAAFVFAIAFTGIFGVYSGVMDVAERVRDEGELLQTGRLVLRQIGDDLAGFHPPIQDQTGQTGSDAGQSLPALVAGGDRAEEDQIDVSRAPDLARSFHPGKIVLELTTSASLDFESERTGDGLVRVQYVLRPRENAGVFEDKGPYTLVRKERLDPDIHSEGDPAGAWTEVELCDRVTELTLTFRARAGQAVESWGITGLGQPVDSGALPASARVRLVLVDDVRGREFRDVISLAPELLREKQEGGS